MFSKACEYGIRATLYIALKSLDKERVSLKFIAEKIDAPVAFTAKVLQILSKTGIVSSIKGPNGGFEISDENLEKITLMQIVKAIDGDKLFTVCGLGLKECSSTKPCPIHHKFLSVRNEMIKILSGTSLKELSGNIDKGISFLRL